MLKINIKIRDQMNQNYWLMKVEPEAYSLETWKKEKVTYWDGVRNFMARNFMRDTMKKRDQMFFYYSNSHPSGIVAQGQIVREGYPDFTAFDPQNIHFDPQSDSQNPKWYMVDVQYVKECRPIISLKNLKECKDLKNMMLFRMPRLSVQPVGEKEWKIIQQLGHWINE